ncbi:hypothetical protein ACVWZK_008746 [Bradyrhizobium sp. GM0.4]
MNHLVLSGTATLVLSRTRSSCYRGPESSLSACFSALSSRSNFTNILTLTSCCESVRCEQVGCACNEDAACIYSLTRKTSPQYDYFRQRTRAHAIARKSARSSETGAPHHDRCFPLRQLARRGELANIRGWHDDHHKPESEEWAIRLTSAVHDGFKGVHEAAGKESCDLTQNPVSSGDAAPPCRKEKARVEAAGSRRPLHRRSDPAALAAGAKAEGRAINPDLVQQHGEGARHGRCRALQTLLPGQQQAPQPCSLKFFGMRVRIAIAASYNIARVSSSPHFEMLPMRSVCPDW